jgi:hypothetical protein
MWQAEQAQSGLLCVTLGLHQITESCDGLVRGKLRAHKLRCVADGCAAGYTPTNCNLYHWRPWKVHSVRRG